MYDIIQVELTNWTKFQQGRKDVTHPSWFKLKNSIFEHEEFWSLTREELCFFFYIMCLASKQNSPTIKLNIQKAVTVGKFKKASVISSLKKLEYMKTVKVTRNVDVTSTARERNELDTLEKRREEERREEEKATLDFEVCWKKYPRQTDKLDARERFHRIITVEKDYQDFLLAIDHYSQDCLRLNKEEKHIKHMTTFLGTEDKQRWREWIDPPAAMLSKSDPFSFFNKEKSLDAI